MDPNSSSYDKSCEEYIFRNVQIAQIIRILILDVYDAVTQRIHQM